MQTSTIWQRLLSRFQHCCILHNNIIRMMQGRPANVHTVLTCAQMNIMYFLPSIPLLIVSSLLDEPLDRRFGESSRVSSCWTVAVTC